MKWFFIRLETRDLQRYFRSLITSYIILHSPDIRFYKANAKIQSAEYYISVPDELEENFTTHMKDYNLISIEQPDLKNCILISGGKLFRKNDIQSIPQKRKYHRAIKF